MIDREKLLSVTLDDCDVQHFASGGPGGQNQNKRHTGVRVIHRDSGARGEAREHREQRRNLRAAFTRMAATPQFRFWVAERVRELSGERTREQQVQIELADPNLTRVKVRAADGTWKVEGTH